jgi:exopolysaccharide production protein ExoZ
MHITMFTNIQILRALAAILVVFHHAAPHYHAMSGNFAWFSYIASYGFTGVDIFFVISGFIIANTTFQKKRTWLSAKLFLHHRLARIFIAYWIFLALTWIIFALFSPGKLINIDLLGSIFLINTNMFELLLPISWSLTYELYFYFIFVLLFAFPVGLVKVLIHVLLACMLLRIKFIWIDSGFAYFFLSHFLVEFLAGAILYIHRERFNSLWIALILALTSIIGYVYGIQTEALNNSPRVLSFGVGAIALVGLAITLENCNLRCTIERLIDIGNASYTIYLSHLLFLTLFYSSGIRNFLSNQYWLIGEIGFFTYIAVIVLISILFYKKIEFPIYKKMISNSKAD